MQRGNGMPFPRCKGTLYDQGTHVPLIISWPARIRQPAASPRGAEKGPKGSGRMNLIFDRQDYEIRAAVLRRRGGPLKIESLEMEGPRDDEVLVRIVASGICHTDMDFVDAWTESDEPLVLGHEGAGVVERVGKKVKGVSPGAHVVLSYQSCGRCRRCLNGTPAHCQHFYELNFGFQRQDGSNALHASGVRSPFQVHAHGSLPSNAPEFSRSTKGLCRVRRTVVQLASDGRRRKAGSKPALPGRGSFAALGSLGATFLTLILACGVIPSSQAVTRYVNVNNPTPASPYTSWATAAMSSAWTVRRPFCHCVPANARPSSSRSRA